MIDDELPAAIAHVVTNQDPTVDGLGSALSLPPYRAAALLEQLYVLGVVSLRHPSGGRMVLVPADGLEGFLATLAGEGWLSWGEVGTDPANPAGNHGEPPCVAPPGETQATPTTKECS